MRINDRIIATEVRLISSSGDQVGVVSKAKALEIAGRDLTTDSFIESLESIKDYQSLFGKSVLSWGPDKHLGANAAFLFEVKDGRFIQIDEKEYTY